MRSTDFRAFIPVQPEPSQRIEQRQVALLRVALGVGVFDAEHEDAVTMPRIGPIEQRCANQPDMRNTRWRRAEADPYRHDFPLRTTGFVSIPMFSTVILTVSPSSIGPTPSGVPVRIRSPGNNVITPEIHSMIAPMS